MERLFDFLIPATMARLIDWKPTGEEADYESKKIYRGYQTEIDGFKVTTIVRPHKRNIAFAVAIEKDGKREVFTSNQKAIDGTKDGYADVVAIRIQNEMEFRDLRHSLSQSLARLIYS